MCAFSRLLCLLSLSLFALSLLRLIAVLFLLLLLLLLLLALLLVDLLRLGALPLLHLLGGEPPAALGLGHGGQAEGLRHLDPRVERLARRRDEDVVDAVLALPTPPNPALAKLRARLLPRLAGLDVGRRALALGARLRLVGSGRRLGRRALVAALELGLVVRLALLPRLLLEFLPVG